PAVPKNPRCQRCDRPFLMRNHFSLAWERSSLSNYPILISENLSEVVAQCRTYNTGRQSKRLSGRQDESFYPDWLGQLALCSVYQLLFLNPAGCMKLRTMRVTNTLNI